MMLVIYRALLCQNSVWDRHNAFIYTKSTENMKTKAYQQKIVASSWKLPRRNWFTLIKRYRFVSAVHNRREQSSPSTIGPHSPAFCF